LVADACEHDAFVHVIIERDLAAASDELRRDRQCVFGKPGCALGRL
jgi:hypothetical protein